jgi:release factor glutamine methyltransferase
LGARGAGKRAGVRIVTLPGVFRPHSDTWLLAGCLRGDALLRGASVLDVCTGSGALAVAAARHGARYVTAIDVSRRAVITARINARLNRVRIRALRGDLFAPVTGERFDVIVSNPPYVPAAGDRLPKRGPARAWDAGRKGRLLLDRICDDGPAQLRPGGLLLVVHSSVCGPDETVARLADGGLEVDVVSRVRGPLGPLLTRRATELEARGLLRPGQRVEEMVVVRGRRPGDRDALAVPQEASYS